jgi:outer membrane PBP1 activator LpoA protein
MQAQVEKLLDRFTELMSLSVDQRVETSKIASQLIDNQRQLVATQQILIKLMERSIELTRHITTIEEKLPGLYELPRVVETLRQRVAELEGIETR